LTLQPPFSSSNPVQRPEKKRSCKRGEKRGKNRESPSRDEHEEARSEAASSEPIPTHEAAAASPPRRAPTISPCRKTLRRPCEQRGSAILPRPVPDSVPPIPDCSPAPPGGQLNSRCFSGPIRSPQVRGRRCRRSRWRELSPGQGSCLHCSRVWAANSILARQVPAPTLDSGQFASPPARFLDFAAIGAAPVAMRSPPWLASWELGYGLTLCRKRRKP
jgi:hypothetical protein